MRPLRRARAYYCPFCRRYAAELTQAWLMEPQMVCPICSPNWRPPALWRRVVRAFVDYIRAG